MGVFCERPRIFLVSHQTPLVTRRRGLRYFSLSDIAVIARQRNEARTWPPVMVNVFVPEFKCYAARICEFAYSTYLTAFDSI